MRRLPRALDLTDEGDLKALEEEIRRLRSRPDRGRVLEALNRIDLAVRRAQRVLDGLEEEG